MKYLQGIFSLFVALCFLAGISSCGQRESSLPLDSLSQEARDSIAFLQKYHYTIGTNLLVQQDTLFLVQLPARGLADTILKGDTVVVADFVTDTLGRHDTLWVKLMTGQHAQGWILKATADEALIPINLISLAIDLFSTHHHHFFALALLLFLFYFLFISGKWKREKGKFPLTFHSPLAALIARYGSMERIYLITLLFLVALCAGIYETIQLFLPDTWAHFYFNPTLNPFSVPLPLAILLVGQWLVGIILLAMMEEAYRNLLLRQAIFYLLSLLVGCILCYLFFVWAVRAWIGYPLLLLFLIQLLRHLWHTLTTPTYRCGHCGAPIKQRGKCNACGRQNIFD